MPHVLTRPRPHTHTAGRGERASAVDASVGNSAETAGTRVELKFCVYLRLEQQRPWKGEAPLHGVKNDVRRKIHLVNL